MANADGVIIPWVEGDQGEGIKDFLDECRQGEIDALEELSKKMEGLVKKSG